jgi:hypothetical protein
MTSPQRSLLRALKVLFLALTVLCVLVQPVLAAAHELHEAEHALADVTGGAQALAVEANSPEPGSLDGLLHAFDCCLHATGLPTPVLDWTAQRLGAAPPRLSLPLHAPSPLSRFLRPPIAA